ncbi:MAG TPA: hypothetical protein VKT82_02890 [Ktedonobacterales bacterium]|nr:hypothetical protein [Ktedonobacterales bacterium]
MAHVPVAETPKTGQTASLSGIERILLLVPMLAGLFFGLAPLLEAKLFAQVNGYVGADDEIFVYWTAGAATLAYGIVLALAIREGSWTPTRMPVIAVLGFNACSLFACEEEIRLGRANSHVIVYLILGASIFLCALTIWLLARHRAASRGEPDTARWVMVFLVLATIAAFGTGLLALFLPEQLRSVFGLSVQDVFIYRQLGAATVGYGVMGIFQARSHRWAELRLGSLMAAIFNTLAFIIGITALALGKPPLLPAILVVAPFFLAGGNIAILVRKGK